ncbi:hypothetical protein CVIRNUC_000362 [Coccomyxa viridis]|uniref:Extracellular protein n=1 Tax=Coccomyxa viridis TaxID=1274662 RepID=A0AAV1HQ21_9CHLO|nr:hypothetical protein CVIRNUC_000362 [Coccomyxa viridis]
MGTQSQAVLCLMALAAVHAAAQPFMPGQGLLPLGSPRTSDFDGPYNLTLLDIPTAQIEAGMAAKMNFTDKDVIDFLVNVECLEGLFDTLHHVGDSMPLYSQLLSFLKVFSHKARPSSRSIVERPQNDDHYPVPRCPPSGLQMLKVFE